MSNPKAELELQSQVTKRKQKVDSSFRQYMYESAVLGNPFTGKELQMALRANSAIKATKGMLAYGAGNQHKDLESSKGMGRHTLSHARALKKNLESFASSHNVALDSTTTSALSAEIVRGANCGEHADLTTLNLVSQPADHSLKAQRMTLNPELDHAFAQLTGSEKRTKWVKQSTGKWAKQGQETVQHTIVADAWITQPHAVRHEDWEFSGIQSRERRSYTVTGQDKLSEAKQKLGISSSYVQRQRQKVQSYAFDDYDALKRKNKGNRLHLWDNNRTTSSAFKQKLADPMDRRNALLDDIDAKKAVLKKAVHPSGPVPEYQKRNALLSDIRAARVKLKSGN